MKIKTVNIAPPPVEGGKRTFINVLLGQNQHRRLKLAANLAGLPLRGYLLRAAIEFTDVVLKQAGVETDSVGE